MVIEMQKPLLDTGYLLIHLPGLNLSMSYLITIARIPPLNTSVPGTFTPQMPLNRFETPNSQSLVNLLAKYYSDDKHGKSMLLYRLDVSYAEQLYRDPLLFKQ